MAEGAAAVGRRGVLLGAAAAGLAACSGRTPEADPSASPTSPGTPASSPTAPTPSTTPTARPGGPPRPRLAGEVVTGLAVPWAIVFLPDGSALVSQRDSGEVTRIDPSGRTRTVGRVDGIEAGGSYGGEGGLLGLALGPDGRWLYAFLTTPDDNRLVRVPWPGWGEPEVLLDGLAANTYHNAGALAFGPDGMLYVSTGDAGEPANAPDRGSLNGKILRLTPEGEPAPGNPFGTEVFSLGHRNIEGLAFDEQGRLWASEFGDQETDELNRIVAGGDYGWPAAEGSDGPGGGRDPLAQWPTDACSPAGVAIARGRAWLGALQGECLWSVDLVTGETERHLEGHGRLRSVAAAPDGSLWVGTSNRDGRGSPRDGDDRILRVTL